MSIDHVLQRSLSPAPQPISRRRFVTMSVGGSVGLVLLPSVLAQQKADVPPGQKPTEQPSAFVTIAPDGTTTVLCNRMDMGQGIETALAMVCAEELGVDWNRVKTGFGNAAPNYVDPLIGLHITGGSSSVKHSYTQYRELGARTRAMLIAAAAAAGTCRRRRSWPTTAWCAAGGRSASYGELFDAAMKEPIPETVVLKDPKDFKRIGKPTGLKPSRAKSNGQQVYGIDVNLPNQRVAVIAHPPVFGAKVKSFDAAAAQKVAGVSAVLPVNLDRGGRGVAVVANGYWPAKTGRDALKPSGTPKVSRRPTPPRCSHATASSRARPARSRRAEVPRRRGGHRAGGAAHRSRVRVPVPQPCADGAAGLHGRPEGRPLRRLHRIADARHRRDGDRPAHRACRPARAHPCADGRWRLRPPRDRQARTTWSNRWRWPRRSPPPGSGRR